MRVLVFTNMYPTPTLPFYGSFVRDEAEALRAAGVDVDVYFVNGRRSKSEYFASPFGFWKRMRSRRYDVVHAHHSFCVFVASMQKRVPLVWTFHEGEVSSPPDVVRSERVIKRLAYSKGFKRRMARRVDALIVVADHLKEPLGRPDAITLPSGIDTELFRPMDKTDCKRRLGLDPGRRYLLFPSTPARVEKRHALAAEAVARYREGGGDAELIWLDDVPHGDVPLYMNASEAVLMTSAFEASPVTIREALACNVPVVSTDVGDARTVVDDVEGCYIVPPDPAQIADKLRLALERQGPFTGRERVERYSLEGTAQRLVAIYKRVADARKGRVT